MTFPPAREADLLAASENFKQKTTATPEDFGLTAAQASDFSTLQGEFALRYAVATNPATRTSVTIQEKDQAKEPMIAKLRELTRVVQNTPGMDNARRELLGIPLRKPEPTPQPIPQVAPGLQIVSVVGHVVTGRLWDTEEPERRGKPAFVDGALIWKFVGSEAPANINDWTLVGAISRTSFKVTFPDTVPAGAKVFLTAAWMNERKLTGPACDAVGLYLGGGILGLNQAA